MLPLSFCKAMKFLLRYIFYRIEMMFWKMKTAKVLC